MKERRKNSWQRQRLKSIIFWPGERKISMQSSLPWFMKQPKPMPLSQTCSFHLYLLKQKIEWHTSTPRASPAVLLVPPGRGCSVPHARTQKHTGQQPAPVRANSSEATQLELMLRRNRLWGFAWPNGGIVKKEGVGPCVSSSGTVWCFI